MSRRAAAMRVLASVLLAALACSDVARADRLDAAARALRAPGVWVDADLTWLVGPSSARRLDREIGRAGVPVRVAVLPQVAVDESRGDRRAIARAIIRRVGSDGLYVLVDQEGRVAYAARRLALDLRESSFPAGSGLGGAPLSEHLAALVPTIRDARPAPPVSFEPFANPQGVATTSGEQHDPLVLVALVCALVGGLLGVGLHVCVRRVLGATNAWGRRA